MSDKERAYLTDKVVHRPNRANNGTFSALPNIVNFVCKIIWSMLMDKLKAKSIITPTFAVRLSQSV
ncbi:hypothetical protein ANCDUO_22028, partial [Ancylostoma duodenale]